jgi:hypothetical protein
VACLKVLWFNLCGEALGKDEKPQDILFPDKELNPGSPT